MTFQNLIKSEKPILIDFFAHWCGPCKMLSPIIQEVKNEIGSDARVVKIDIDKNQKLSQELGINSVPTLMIYKNGEMKWHALGVKTKHEILSQINALK